MRSKLDCVDARRAQPFAGVGDGGNRLDTMDEFLDVRREILDPKACPGNAGACHALGALLAQRARIGFNRDLDLVAGSNPVLESLQQPGQILIGEHGRRAAAKMNARYAAMGRQGLAEKIYFLVQRAHIARDPVIFMGRSWYGNRNRGTDAGKRAREHRARGCRPGRCRIASGGNHLR